MSLSFKNIWAVRSHLHFYQNLIMRGKSLYSTEIENERKPETSTLITAPWAVQGLEDLEGKSGEKIIRLYPWIGHTFSEILDTQHMKALGNTGMAVILKTGWASVVSNTGALSETRPQRTFSYVVIHYKSLLKA